jgi:ribosomal protein S18 acetylase RimI-like enzyme
MREFEVRRFGEGESVGELTALLHRAYASLAAMGLRFTATWQDDAVTRERIGRGECWVVCHGRAIVGTILFQDAESTSGCPWYDRPGVASAHQFAVDPLFQGMGIGRLLLDLAERRARETGAREIALDTAESAAHLIAKYERRGYRIVDRVQWETTNYRSVVMSKEISE